MTNLLIADDEDDMLLLLRMVIQFANDGLEVVAEARSGVEALETFASYDGQLDVVVLDNRMPVMTGLEAAADILRSRPEQPIILYSAHLNDAVRREAQELGIRACLHKNEIERVPEIARSLAA